MSHLPSFCQPCQLEEFYGDPPESRIRLASAPRGPHNSTWEDTVKCKQSHPRLESRICCTPSYSDPYPHLTCPPSVTTLGPVISTISGRIITCRIHHFINDWYRLQFDEDVLYNSLTCRIPMRLFIGSVFSWHIYGPAVKYFSISLREAFLKKRNFMKWVEIWRLAYYINYRPKYFFKLYVSSNLVAYHSKFQVEPESSSWASAMVSIHLNTRVLSHVLCLLLFVFECFSQLFCNILTKHFLRHIFVVSADFFEIFKICCLFQIYLLLLSSWLTLTLQRMIIRQKTIKEARIEKEILW